MFIPGMTRAYIEPGQDDQALARTPKDEDNE